MSGSSGDAKLLSKISVGGVTRLLAVLSTLDSGRSSLVERRYGEHAQNFEETLRFLVDVAWVRNSNGVLVLTEAGASASRLGADDAQIRAVVLRAVVDVGSPYRLAVARYLRRFEIENARVVQRPALSERIKQRAVRDLLMNLRVVEYVPTEDLYLLESGANDLYLWALDFGNLKDRKTLERVQRRRQDLGFAAEVIVYEYERARVGAELARHVDHVSQERPFSSYDIKSVTKTDGGLLDRYIEVKAVPPDSLRFFWSRSELQAAQLLGDKYFLYLLPYEVDSGFDISALNMIGNPYATVYSAERDWFVEEDVVLCKRRDPYSRPTNASSED